MGNAHGENLGVHAETHVAHGGDCRRKTVAEGDALKSKDNAADNGEEGVGNGKAADGGNGFLVKDFAVLMDEVGGVGNDGSRKCAVGGFEHNHYA